VTVTAGTLLGGRISYTQPATGFRSGIEPVLLAAAIPARPGETVLEAGTGAGAGLLCLAARVGGIGGGGVESDPGAAELAARNLSANGFARLTIATADIRDFTAAAPCDHAFANPPYHAPEGTPSPDAMRDSAKRAASDTLATWVAALTRNTVSRGSVTLILPAAVLPAALSTLAGSGCGGIHVLPLWPKAARPAKLVIVQARKGARGKASLLPGLVLHEADGRFTAAAEAILRDGAALPLS